jgi:transcriptional regulator with XRE-family HTH domain
MKKSFGSKLKELRGDQSQASVASLFGIAQQTYGGWEKDQRKPDLTELCSICSHYAVSSDWLLGLSSDPPPTEKHVSVGEKTVVYVAECPECKKKQAHIDRLERVIDKLTK